MCPFKKCATECQRLFFGLLFVACAVLIGIASYMQHTLSLNPCPMCILQRFSFMAIGVLGLVATLSNRRCWHMALSVLIIIVGIFGMYLSARQSWIQWYPPVFSSCGRDFYNILQSFPLSHAIPLLLQGTGECTMVDWSFLGMSIANYACIFFTLITLCVAVFLFRLLCLSKCSKSKVTKSCNTVCK